MHSNNLGGYTWHQMTTGQRWLQTCGRHVRDGHGSHGFLDGMGRAPGFPVPSTMRWFIRPSYLARRTGLRTLVLGRTLAGSATGCSFFGGNAAKLVHDRKVGLPTSGSGGDCSGFGGGGDVCPPPSEFHNTLYHDSYYTGDISDSVATTGGAGDLTVVGSVRS